MGYPIRPFSDSIYMGPDYYQDLLQRYLDGRCTAGEAEELFAWLSSDAGRRPLLKALQQEFQAHVGDPAPVEVSERIRKRLLANTRPVRPLVYRLWPAAAAAAALLLGLGVYSWKRHVPAAVNPVTPVAAHDVAPGGNRALLTLASGRVITLDSAVNGQLAAGVVKLGEGQLAYPPSDQPGNLAYNTLSTPRGGQYRVVLSDGTKVWLNASSSLEYPTAFGAGERKVSLTGEGYFEVATDTKRPFRVVVGNMTVAVLGTRFDVMAYNDEAQITTTLLQGGVRVSNGAASVPVQPGQAARLEMSTGRLGVAVADTESAVAWKNGYFRFNGVDLPVVMRQLSRWYGVDVSYTGAGERTYEFVGTVARSSNLSSVLKVLEINGVKVTVDGRKLIVTP